MVSSKPRSLPQMFRKVFKRNFLQQQPSLLVQNVAQIVNKTCTTHFVGCLPLFGSMIIPTSVYSVRNKKRIMHSKIHPHWNLKVHSWQAAEKLKNPHISDWHCELRKHTQEHLTHCDQCKHWLCSLQRVHVWSRKDYSIVTDRGGVGYSGSSMLTIEAAVGRRCVALCTVNSAQCPEHWDPPGQQWKLHTMLELHESTV